MTAKHFVVVLLLLSTHIISIAQTTIVGGNVSGRWPLAGSPYLINGPIQIPIGETLVIDPGVVVDFQGPYKLYVQGRLLAEGTPVDTIVFTCSNITEGWRGIRFENTPASQDTSKITYCKIQYGKAIGSGTNSQDGGAIFIMSASPVLVANCLLSDNNSYYEGGAIFCTGGSTIRNNAIYNNSSTEGSGGGISCSSTSVILNNYIHHNTAKMGGGIDCLNDGPLVADNIIIHNTARNAGGGISFGQNKEATFIYNNVISNNSAPQGGGVYLYSSKARIINNVISNNSAVNDGGGIKCFDSNVFIVNNTISNNKAQTGGGLTCDYNSKPIIMNTILWNNTATNSGPQVYLRTENADPDLTYCNIQGGKTAFGLNGNFHTGTYSNNLDQNPLFDFPNGPNDDDANSWSLKASSPCINQGNPSLTSLNLPMLDLAGNPRISGERVDIGAYEFNSTTTSVFNYEKDNLFLYPNPATDFLYMKTEPNTFIEIINSNGIVELSQITADGYAPFYIGNFDKGFYLVRTRHAMRICTRKFIKK